MFSKHRINILLWFARRPRLYKQFIREIFSFLRRKNHPTLDRSIEAEEWCESQGISVEDAFQELFSSYQYIEVEEKFPEVMNDSHRIVASKSFNWGGQGNVSLNYNIAEAIDASCILETGVAYGWSTLSILLSLDSRQKGHLCSVDMPFMGVENEEDIGCVIPESLKKDRWTLLRLPDREGLPEAIKNSAPFDFCHYDSDKSYSGKKWAYPKIWKALRPGGVLISDDISDNIAFKEFSDLIQVPPTIIKTFDTQVEKFVGLLIKPT